MKTILISGCTGFIGQNLTHKLINDYHIIGVDNFYSSNPSNINQFINSKNFDFIESDIANLNNFKPKVDYVINLACPASPPIYQKDPLYTLETNYTGTKNLLNIANSNDAVFIQASTSEVYGDPKIHPQTEGYFGNVNTVGVRSCYDEGKRIAETLCYEFRKKFNLQTRIIRIFNTYGPGMDKDDGRVISNFMINSINKSPLIIYGNGEQTRSFCYIDDLLSGIIKSMHIDFKTPVNLGNNQEISLNDLASLFNKMFGENEIIYREALKDDPKVRKPDITKARGLLKWSPKISLSTGIKYTFDYFKSIN
jgi:nucleoside-diphosphate-sugar epimerase